MAQICEKCGKVLELDGVAFCPYCGAPVPVSPASQPEQPVLSPEAETWLQKIRQAENLPARKKVALQAQSACPGCFPIEWEILFIGHEKKRGAKGIDFSIIKSFLLKMYMNPNDFTEDRKQQDRQELFEDPQLLRCLEMSGDPDRALRDYLLRLSREFFDFFIRGDSTIVRSLFGIRLDRHPEKTLSIASAGVMNRVLQDQQLSSEKRNLLYHALYEAVSLELGGQTQWLDEALRIK